MLTNNRLKHLVDLEPLGQLTRLKHVSLMGNPVTKQPGYRLFVINRCKNLKALDFRRVKESEREEAETKFGGKAAPAPADVGGGERDFDPDAEFAEATGEGSQVQRPTKERMTAIRAAIAAASTMEEVKRLEEALETGDDTTMMMQQ